MTASYYTARIRLPTYLPAYHACTVRRCRSLWFRGGKHARGYKKDTFPPPGIAPDNRSLFFSRALDRRTQIRVERQIEGARDRVNEHCPATLNVSVEFPRDVAYYYVLLLLFYEVFVSSFYSLRGPAANTTVSRRVYCFHFLRASSFCFFTAVF